MRIVGFLLVIFGLTACGTSPSATTQGQASAQTSQIIEKSAASLIRETSCLYTGSNDFGPYTISYDQKDFSDGSSTITCSAASGFSQDINCLANNPMMVTWSEPYKRPSAIQPGYTVQFRTDSINFATDPADCSILN